MSVHDIFSAIKVMRSMWNMLNAILDLHLKGHIELKDHTVKSLLNVMKKGEPFLEYADAHHAKQAWRNKPKKKKD